MSKIARITQKIFGSTAGLNRRAEIGSLAAGSPTFTTDPTVMQSLPNFLQGMDGIVIGNNSPAIQDLTSLFYVLTYQLAYLLQSGAAEWDAGTTYFQGSIVNGNSGVLFFSRTDNNLNNALTDPANWQIVGQIADQISAARTITAFDDLIRYDTNGGPITQALPSCASIPIGKKLIFKNIGSSGNLLTLTSTDTIDGLANIALQGSSTVREAVTLSNSGLVWFII